MTNIPNEKPEALETHTFRFAKNCRVFIKGVSRSITNIEYSKQLARSSASIAANYIEANEALSKKDFIMRSRICRKETKESRMWLELIEVSGGFLAEQDRLVKESTELLKIFSAIINKSLCI